jgi:hypothetical protein
MLRRPVTQSRPRRILLGVAAIGIALAVFGPVAVGIVAVYSGLVALMARENSLVTGPSFGTRHRFPPGGDG